MNTSPFISVIMPVYNVAKFLELSVTSVLKQDYSNFELLLIDDGSTDNSFQLCNQLASVDSRIKVIHKKNEGLGYSRNKGLDISCGDYVYFLDSDDTIQPNTLSRFVDIINREGDLSFISTGFQYVGESNRMKEANVTNKETIFCNKSELQRKFLLREIIILAPGTLYNRKWLQTHNLRFKKIPYSEDQLFVWEALLSIDKVAHIHDAQYNYLQRPGSIMTSSKFVKIKEAYPFFKELNRQIQSSRDADVMVKKYMLARWSFGIFHSGAKLCTYSEYKQLLSELEANTHIHTISSFPDLKMRILAYSSCLGKRCFYLINRAL